MCICIQCLVATFSGASRGQRLTAEHKRPHSRVYGSFCACALCGVPDSCHLDFSESLCCSYKLHCPAIFDARVVNFILHFFCVFFVYFFISWVGPVFNKIKNIIFLHSCAYSVFSHVLYIIWFSIGKMMEIFNFLKPAFLLLGFVLSGSSPKVSVLFQAGLFHPSAKEKN